MDKTYRWLKSRTSDPDILGSWPALKRAAKAARKLAIDTGTPFYVMVDGKVVDLNENKKLTRAKKRARRAARKTAA